MFEDTVVLNVTVRCGFAGVALLPLDMDDISGVVSVELDAIVVRGSNLRPCRDDWPIYRLRCIRTVAQLKGNIYGSVIRCG